jgi:hypothetical protein
VANAARSWGDVRHRADWRLEIRAETVGAARGSVFESPVASR